MPVNKWMNLQIDCASFLDSSSSSSPATGTRFKSLEAIIISAPCLIRRIFTSKKSFPGSKIQGEHPEDVPKLFSFPADIESENILVSLSSVIELTRQKHSFMADTFNSKFRDSIGGLESLQSSTNNENNLVLQKCQSSYSDGKQQQKIKKSPCDIIRELPLLQQQKGQQNYPGDLSTPKVFKQGINKYPLPPSSSSSTSSAHVKYTHGGYQGRNTVSQEQDNKEFQTTAMSDLRGSVNTIFSAKLRIATSPHDGSSIESSNQLQNASSSTLNSTAASKGLRLNSRLGNHTPLSTHKPNNTNRFNAQSKSPKVINSAATTTTAKSAAKSNPWSINNSKANKVNYNSVDGKSESAENVSGVKSFTDLTPERTRQSQRIQGEQPYLKSKTRDDKSTASMQKQFLQGSSKNQINVKKPGVSQERRTPPPPPKKNVINEGNRKQVEQNRNRLKEAEYFEMSQKFSTLGDPKLFQIEYSTENEKCSQLKGKAHQSNLPVIKVTVAAARSANAQNKQQLQSNNKSVAHNNRKDAPSFYARGNSREEEEEQIEEVIETEFNYEDDGYDDKACNKNDFYSMDNHLSGNKNKTLNHVGSGYMNKYKKQMSDQESQELHSAAYNDEDDNTAMKQANANNNGMNQNSTGLSFTKPNLIVKRKQSIPTDLAKTGQQMNSHAKPSREEVEEKNKLDVYQGNRNQNSDGKKNYELFRQQLPDIDEQTIPDMDTLKQSQTNFFKQQMNAFTASIRPFTPPFSQAGKVASVANQSTLSMSNKRVKEMDQSDHQIEVIYDDVLNCYYDPKTNQYFELKS